MNVMAPLDLSQILKNYEGKWVALSDDNKTVYGAGFTAKEAAREAQSKEYAEFALLFVQPSNFLYR